MKILIAEDEEVLQKVLVEKFQNEKYALRTVTRGTEVLETSEVFKPDCILLDLMLPGMDGFEVLKQLKSDPELKQIPVIVLSNLGQDDEIKRVLALGAVDYLVKTQHPIDEVVEKVHMHVLKHD